MNKQSTRQLNTVNREGRNTVFLILKYIVVTIDFPKLTAAFTSVPLIITFNLVGRIFNHFCVELK